MQNIQNSKISRLTRFQNFSGLLRLRKIYRIEEVPSILPSLTQVHGEESSNLTRLVVPFRKHFYSIS